MLYLAAVSSTGGEASTQRYLVEALKRYSRSIELCDDYLRGYYGLKLVSCYWCQPPRGLASNAAPRLHIGCSRAWASLPSSRPTRKISPSRIPQPFSGSASWLRRSCPRLCAEARRGKVGGEDMRKLRWQRPATFWPSMRLQSCDELFSTPMRPKQ